MSRGVGTAIGEAIGGAIGAVAPLAIGLAGWAWTTLSRRRSNRSAPPVRAASNGAPQVFVSYSRQDGPTVEQLVQQIEQLGYPVWIDRQSAGSQRYAAPIVRAIRTSRLVALMCSQNAFASDHVIREVYVAGDYKKPFIAFQLDSTEFPDEILYFVSGFPRVPVATIDRQQLTLRSPGLSRPNCWSFFSSLPSKLVAGDRISVNGTPLPSRCRSPWSGSEGRAADYLPQTKAGRR